MRVEPKCDSVEHWHLTHSRAEDALFSVALQVKEDEIQVSIFTFFQTFLN